MFQPFTFARPQQIAPGGYGYPIAPSGFAQVASHASPWVSPSAAIAPAGQADPMAYYAALTPVMQVLILLSTGFSAYHGYKRNHDNVGWAFGWGALGAIFPVIVPIVAIAEGYAKPVSSK